MTVEMLIEQLKQCPQDLDVRVETGTDENQWVYGLEVHHTGSSGYELNGEVVLSIGE